MLDQDEFEEFRQRSYSAGYMDRKRYCRPKTLPPRKSPAPNTENKIQSEINDIKTTDDNYEKVKEWIFSNESSEFPRQRSRTYCTRSESTRQGDAECLHSAISGTGIKDNVPRSVTYTNNGNIYNKSGLTLENLSKGLHDLDICQSKIEKSKMYSSIAHRSDKMKDTTVPLSQKSYTSDIVNSNHMRSVSYKSSPHSRHPQELDLEEDVPRHRTYSMPTHNTFHRPKPNKAQEVSRSVTKRSGPLLPLSCTSNIVNSNHMRSRSCKAGHHSRQSHELDLGETLPRQRTYSMPTRNTMQRPNLNKIRANYDDVTYYHVRTFSTSANKIVRRGSSIKRRGSNKQLGSCASQASTGSRQSIGSETEIPVYKVVVVGSQSVGKTSLIQQLISHDHMTALNTSLDDDTVIHRVPVMVDDKEASLEFVDVQNPEDLTTDTSCDAYAICYSVTDRTSFDDAIEILYDIRKDEAFHNTAIILVANKGDLVRNREVTEQEGKTMAVHYSCKYIEVSAVLNLKLDELLVGIVKQIQLLHTNSTNKSPKKFRQRLSSDNSCLTQAARGIAGKILSRKSRMFRSCDNLFM